MILGREEVFVDEVESFLKGFDVTVVRSKSVSDAVRKMDISRFELVISQYEIPGGDVIKLSHKMKDTTENKSSSLLVIDSILDKEKVGYLLLNKIKNVMLQPLDKTKFREFVRKVLKIE